MDRDGHAINQAMKATLVEEASKLSRQDRLIFLLHQDRVSIAEIATVLDLPEITVKFRLNFTLEKLRSAIYFENPDES